MEALKVSPISLEEYLVLEQRENTRYEFHDGYIHAMAGGSFKHGLIGSNINGELYGKLKAKNSACNTINSDVKLYIKSGNRFVYPDAMVICGKFEMSDVYKEAITNPVLIVEVLSESTESYDRGDKFFFYRQIKSLKHYLLVSQDKAQVELYSRGEGGFWKIDRVTGLDSVLHLSAIDVELALAEVYRNVELEG